MNRIPLTTTAPLPVVERARGAVRDWLRGGADRGRNDALTIARAALAAGLAYLASGLIWGHEFPFFSSIVAFVIIGFGIEKKMRKVVEMAGGVMLGVLLGELARQVIGSGPWQIFIVVFCAGMLARFLDSSGLFGFQVTIQSLLVMIMPVTPGMSPGGRALDALTGVTVALLIHLLLSGNPRRLQTRAAQSFYRELEDALVSLALSARTGDRGVAGATLRTLRDVSQKYTDEWRLANDVANEMATFSPSGLRHAEDVGRIQHLLVGSDRAMRNMRMIARRQVEFLEAVRGDAHSTLADALLAARDAVQELRVAVSHEEVDFTDARRQLRLFCSYLSPEMLLRNDEGLRPGRAGHFEGVTLTVQLRSLAIDLLQATGLTSVEAKRFLPSLVIASDGDAIGPRPMTVEMKAVEPPATTEALELLIADRSDPDRRG
ncbi:aromatic acid exporter family protein [Brachybacterium sp. EE-P12]|uniref:FUSC family protein n=1 Tax=Candidatus Brachybacterium intestinipullorum TaxID=2838512 RepID=A0A9D2PYG2_9MICO|nr:FUSC family protein [Brachybacterium sp. EE-P12]HJC69648.1 FUSC family protein [Candidatus Brachybacterium intestinipullorum]